MRVRIVGTKLPGRKFGAAENVHVGVQRGREVVDQVPGDADSAVFEFDVTVAETATGPDFRGPYVHGRRGARFLYLSWGNLEADGSWSMFRRAKLHICELPSDMVGCDTVEAQLTLTDECGGPRCASVRPPLLTWVAGT
ncbi:DUF5990 family protein [Antrihabitans sp. YC2-6]|uniref:DUF5990 family protein n=1 Tax=Antrihabitans sp. YC2-6 TaxID=2799498 RepID=UPI0018F28056|nr:DUF5990 family protein [Antrihabitans sp. YC2-6]MBJ8346257.1 monooxygenase [Antrihabitans sp. YC2-6]